ncbi:nucleotidyltransferase-like protein [Brevibacillus fulvus]|uniref:Nucleotidyltransferase-like domain-containing protein n=1 Tax=Brevibacillus fulvus TaxID=1125967 RepID=A0A939BRN9_9BACL|nr:nucleotidyltransferase-like protein [Brevibacillus fulvus]MBM7589832.1 hypothetical protein [Brevibacillus fulvus]
MEHVHTYIENIAKCEDVLSVLAITQPEQNGLFADGAHRIYLVISDRPGANWSTNYFVFAGCPIVEHRFSRWQIERWAMHGLDEQMARLFASARIVHDDGDYMKRKREQLLKLPSHLQKLQICKEYSLFLRFFTEAKELFRKGHILDCFLSLQQSLRRWARLVAYEMNEYPDHSVWMQIKQFDSAVYKLYEELVIGNEPLAKRIELLMIPIEVGLLAKLEPSSQYIIDILGTRNKPWLLSELFRLPQIDGSGIELHLLLDKMVKRSLVQEIILSGAGDYSEKAYLLSD